MIGILEATREKIDATYEKAKEQEKRNKKKKKPSADDVKEKAVADLTEQASMVHNAVESAFGMLELDAHKFYVMNDEHRQLMATLFGVLRSYNLKGAIAHQFKIVRCRRRLPLAM